MEKIRMVFLYYISTIIIYIFLRRYVYTIPVEKKVLLGEEGKGFFLKLLSLFLIIIAIFYTMLVLEEDFNSALHIDFNMFTRIYSAVFAFLYWRLPKELSWTKTLFHYTGDDSNTSFANQPYRVCLKGKIIQEGITDAEGTVYHPYKKVDICIGGDEKCNKDCTSKIDHEEASHDPL